MNIEHELMLLGLSLLACTMAAVWGYQLAKFRYYDREEEYERTD